jgi:hypothetical protein
LGPDQAHTAEQNELSKQHFYDVSFHRFTSSEPWMAEMLQRMAQETLQRLFPH